MAKKLPKKQSSAFNKQFSSLDSKSRKKWEKGLAQFHEKLSAEAGEYVEKQRIRCAEIAELSQTYMLG